MPRHKKRLTSFSIPPRATHRDLYFPALRDIKTREQATEVLGMLVDARMQALGVTREVALIAEQKALLFWANQLLGDPAKIRELYQIPDHITEHTPIPVRLATEAVVAAQLS